MGNGTTRVRYVLHYLVLASARVEKKKQAICITSQFILFSKLQVSQIVIIINMSISMTGNIVKESIKMCQSISDDATFKRLQSHFGFYNWICMFSNNLTFT